VPSHLLYKNAVFKIPKKQKFSYKFFVYWTAHHLYSRVKRDKWRQVGLSLFSYQLQVFIAFRHFRKIEKKDYWLRHCNSSVSLCVCPSPHLSVRPSVRPLGTTRLPLEGFSWNLIMCIFRKSLEIVQASLKSEKNNRYSTSSSIYSFGHISLNSSWIRQVSDKICRVSQNERFIFNKFSLKWCRLRDNVEKYCGTRQATYFAHAICMLDK